MRRLVTLKSWPNDWLPFYWSRPEKIPGYFKTGDALGLGHVEPTDLRPSYKLSQKLNQLPQDDWIRRIYTDDFASRRDIMNGRIEENLKKLGLFHSQDLNNSMEGKIVFLTWKTRYFQDILRQSKCNDRLKYLRTKCNSTANKRNKLIKLLREQHEERCDALCKALEIDYDSPQIGTPFQRIERKRELRRLVVEYCQNLKEQKVEEYIKSIEDEKEKFEHEKQETLKWIKEQEELLGISVNK